MFMTTLNFSLPSHVAAFMTFLLEKMRPFNIEIAMSASSGVPKNTCATPSSCLSYTTTLVTRPNLAQCSRSRPEYSRILAASSSNSRGSKTFRSTTT